MALQPKRRKKLPNSKIKSTSTTNRPSVKAITLLLDQVTKAVLEKLTTHETSLVRSSRAITKARKKPTVQPTSFKEGDLSSLASMIDHTLLKPDATHQEIKRVCEEARKHHFATVCVNSAYVDIVAELLKGSSTKPIAVVGFPLGAASSPSKAFEASEAIRAGAKEIDMVINIGALKGRDYEAVLEDIRRVVEASNPYPVKVILETASLTQEEKVIGCALAKAAGAAFVKTSTGFGAGGATVEDIQLMRRVVGPEMGVKASGGIRTYDDAIKMIKAGANRIGASASVAMITQAQSTQTTSTSKTNLY
jgi:deoxyribose-phosphate aldolase